jgi:cbb3-type cytochrome oxidase maturation protein
MASLYLLIPVSLIFCALAVAIFFWAVNSGQYDDLDGEGERILFEEDADLEKPQEKSLKVEELREEKRDEVKPNE